MSELKKIEEYLSEHLGPMLLRFGVSEEYKNEILKNVRMQIYSFCSHWNESEFRNALFVLGLEEGLFYEPTSPLNPFVVVAIRNSLLETVQSENHKKAGLSKHLDESFVKSITRQAIECFMDIDMDKASSQVSIDPSEDLYGLTAQKYPMAWTALVKIGNTASNVITFPPIETVHHPDMFARFESVTERYNSTSVTVVADGYLPDIDDGLKSTLRHVILTGAVFYVGNFKTVTRNFEKLLCILEYVLYNQRCFATCNYYITNGYIAKRSPLLRAGHSIDDNRRDLENITGLRKAHREVLQEAFRASNIGKERIPRR